MNEEKKEGFRRECTAFLLSKGTHDLRNYARKLGVAVPTTKKKTVLAKECVALLLWEEQGEWSTRGAPVKNGVVPDDMVLEIAQIWDRHFGEEQIEEPFEQEFEQEPITVKIEQKEETEDILSTLTEEQKKTVNAFLKFLKDWK